VPQLELDHPVVFEDQAEPQALLETAGHAEDAALIGLRLVEPG
jgi:hypothetical protein